MSRYRGRIRSLGPLGLTVIAVLIIYRGCLLPGLITAGDFPYFSLQHLRDGVSLSPIWQASLTLGGYDILDAPSYIAGFLQGLLALSGVGWETSERLFWIIPALLIPCVSTYYLSITLFNKQLGACIAALFITTNSYAYLLLEGGQFGVAIGYACIPLVLWLFMRALNNRSRTSYVLPGLAMAFQAAYDIRSTFLTVAVCVLFSLTVRGRRTGPNLVPACLVLGLSLAIMAILHAWWILPAVFIHAPSLPAGYASVSEIRPLSEMTFVHGFALSHPFWFANNGRTSLPSPAFFLSTIFIACYMLRFRKDQPAQFLSVLLLISIFLVKGDRDPAGGMYDWLFTHIPGFSLFRDPSKFFQPLALSFALLLGGAGDWLIHKVVTGKQFFRPVGACIAILFVGAITILPAYPALLHEAKGALATNPMPPDFQSLNNLIDSQSTYFRVLWVPARPRFGGSSNLHPSLNSGSGSPCCGLQAVNPTETWSWLLQKSAASTLRALSVRYIVIAPATAENTIGEPGLTLPVTATVDNIPALISSAIPHEHIITIGSLRVIQLPPAAPQVAVTPCRSRCVSFGATPLGFDIQVVPSAVNATLALNNSFDPGWLAIPVPANITAFALLSLKPLPASTHRVFNGYANSWIMTPQTPHHLLLVYWPNVLSIIGLCIGMLLLIGLLIGTHWRSRGQVKHTPAVDEGALG